jgi:putative DNA methylase
MIPYRKKLIEVGLPLVAINAESAREKSIRHGHPSTLHLRWARRPLAACRAVLFSSLVDDPDSDPAFHNTDGSVDEDRAGLKRADLFNFIEELVMWENSNNADVIRTARAEIARCVASRLIETGAIKKDAVVGPKTTAYDLVTRGHCRPIPTGLDKKVGRVRFSFDAAHLPPAEVVNAFLAEHAPPVLDPFAGGGSIPLEAQRLGLRAYASDLNPVPVLINKALIEIPPKFAGCPPVNPQSRKAGPAAKGKGEKQNALVEMEWHGAAGLANDVRYYGRWMRNEAEKRIGHLYPKVEVTAAMAQDRPDLLPYVGQQFTIIAWIWARDIETSNPAFHGCRVPLVRDFWLCKKAGSMAWVEPVIDRAQRTYTFHVRYGTPTSDQKKSIQAGTKIGRGCKFRCLFSDDPIPESHVKNAGMNDVLGASLMALVADGPRSRIYLPPSGIRQIVVDCPTELRGIDSPIANDKRNLWCLLYGFDRFDKLFTPRQLVALTTFSDLVQEVRDEVLAATSGADFDSNEKLTGYADAVATYLAFAVSKASSRNCSLAVWEPGTGFGRLAGALGRQALPMQWVYAETNPLAGAGGDIAGTAESVSKVLDELPVGPVGVVRQLSATTQLEQATISSDPPYYDNIGYADLSDFFYVWLRRSLLKQYPSLFATLVTPKTQELIASPYRHNGDKDAAQLFFERGLGAAFLRMHEVQNNEIPLTIYYAFKQSETGEDTDGNDAANRDEVTVSTGWETMLTGLIRSGFSIHGTWPIRTEAVNALKKNVSALASSIVLVCRSRPHKAYLATRKEFITALRRELPDSLRNLQRGNIAPVDLAQAAIGPGMAVFSRYAKVIESDGSSMTVRTALGIINQSLDEVLAEQEGEFDGDTRWALSWFEQFGMNEGPFGDAETLSKAKNTAVNGLVEAGIVTARAGKVRLVKRDELPGDWNPATDKRLTVWEVTQHLIRTLDQHGELRAAALVQQLGGMADISRDLAYRLYSTCERKKWSQEALAYNSLVVAWSELTKLALAERNREPSATQQEMF